MPTFIDSPWGPIDVDERGLVNTGITMIEPAIRATDTGGNPIILLGLRDGEPSALIADVDGKLRWVELEKVQLDWRYDFKKEAWADTSGKLMEDETE